ncbi:hypothetical protein DFH11DRAFT_435071 [Phellopilus nigrolimitatus]|nr:hypothetical protein DFH11DRAFT_435071 [Phellopilus nigrolimitatus]
MATPETVELDAPHAPHPKAVEAFRTVEHTIKAELVRSRREWGKHQPAMWARAAALDDAALTRFDVARDLVLVRSGETAYGAIIFGKIRIPALGDGADAPEGFVHVRIHDPPNRGESDVIFHSIFTDEGNKDADGHPTTWNAIQTLDTPLEFFNEYYVASALL